MGESYRRKTRELAEEGVGCLIGTGRNNRLRLPYFRTDTLEGCRLVEF